GVNRFKTTRLHLALLQRIRLTELRSGLVGHVLQRDSRECLAAENPITLLVDNPPEPTREGGRIAQRRQAPERLEKRFLGSVLGRLEIAEHGVAVGDGHVLETPDQDAIGIGVPFASTHDQGMQFVHPVTRPAARPQIRPKPGLQGYRKLLHCPNPTGLRRAHCIRRATAYNWPMTDGSSIHDEPAMKRMLQLGNPFISFLFMALADAGPVHAAGDEGWTDLSTLDGWKQPTGKWQVVGNVTLDSKNPKMLLPGQGAGALWNGRSGKTANLVTRQKFGDLEVHLEFMIPRRSNSGVKLEGLYEIQIYDSHG